MSKNLRAQNLYLNKQFPFLIFMIGIITNFGFSQKNTYQFQHINSNNGLKNQYNSFIKKDSKGFVWISSMEGIYRFDGLELKTYLPTKINGLLGKNIQSDFFEDKNENIWFTSYQALNCYIRNKDSFKSFQLVDELGDKINKGYHLFFIEKNRFLWLKADNSIFRYDLIKEEQEKIIDTDGYRFAVDTFNTGQVKTIIACPWISNSGIEIISSKNKTGYKKQTFLKTGLPPDFSKHIEVSKAIIVSDSLIWLFSNRGLIKFVPQNLQKTQLFQLPVQFEDKVLDGELIDRNNILIISRKSGLWLFNQEKGFINNYSSLDGNPKTITTNTLREIYFDNQSHLWLANNFTAAIDYCWRFENSFEYPFNGINNDQSPVVNSIVEDSQGNVLCSTQNQGIFKFDEDGKLLKQFPYSISEKDIETLHPVNRLSIDQDGSIWAMSNQFIYRLNHTSWQTVYRIKGKKLLSLLHLSKKSKLISTSDGVFELGNNVERGQLEINAPIAPEENLQVFQFFKSNNYVFFPNNTNDLIIYTYENEQLNFLKNLKINADVYAIHENKENNIIYLGTSNGLFEFELGDLTLKNVFHKDSRLEGVQFFCIQSDKQGFLWLATNVGLWRYNPLTKEKNNFHLENEFLSNHFSLYANLKSKKGDIWLGIDNGVLSFSPDSIKPYPFVANIHIKSLEVNKEPHVSKEVLDALNYLEFPYNKNTLSFELIGVTNYFPKKVKLRYILEGYDEDWSTIDNGDLIKFVKIPSGRYRLKVFSLNANGLPSDVKEINIVIKSPFWQTAQFIGIMLLFISGLIYGLFQSSVKRKLQKQEAIFRRKQELNDLLQEERNRIAADMHDDLGSGLNSISLLIKSIKRQITTKEISSKLVNVEKKATYLVENMREIIWTMDGSHDNLEELVAYIRHYVVEYFDEHKLTYQSEIPDEIPKLLVSGRKRRNIFLCIKEAAHNIIKHARATNVALSFSFKKDSICITLNDNGKGINQESKNQFGNGMKNMRHRMEQIGGNIEIINANGTRLIFTIPLNGEN